MNTGKINATQSGQSRVHWQQPMEVRVSIDRRLCRKCVTVLWAQTDIIHWFPKLCFKALRKTFAVMWWPEIKDEMMGAVSAGMGSWKVLNLSQLWDRRSSRPMRVKDAFIGMWVERSWQPTPAVSTSGQSAVTKQCEMSSVLDPRFPKTTA